MYCITDKKSAVRTVQKMICHKKNGAFSNEDKEEIRRIQAKHGIEENGTVNFRTFSAIKSEYKILNDESDAQKLISVASEFPYKKGDFGQAVKEINDILSQVLLSYGINEYDISGSLFSEETEMGVRRLCEIFAIEETCQISASFYIRLRKELG